MWAWFMQFVLWRGIRRDWSQAEVQGSIYIQIYCQNSAYTGSILIETKPNLANIYAISDVHFVVGTSAEKDFLTVRLNVCAKGTNSDFTESSVPVRITVIVLPWKTVWKSQIVTLNPFHSQVNVLEILRLEVPAVEHKILRWS